MRQYVIVEKKTYFVLWVCVHYGNARVERFDLVFWRRMELISPRNLHGANNCSNHAEFLFVSCDRNHIAIADRGHAARWENVKTINCRTAPVNHVTHSLTCSLPSISPLHICCDRSGMLCRACEAKKSTVGDLPRDHRNGHHTENRLVSRAPICTFWSTSKWIYRDHPMCLNDCMIFRSTSATLRRWAQHQYLTLRVCTHNGLFTVSTGAAVHVIFPVLVIENDPPAIHLIFARCPEFHKDLYGRSILGTELQKDGQHPHSGTSTPDERNEMKNKHTKITGCTHKTICVTNFFFVKLQRENQLGSRSAKRLTNKWAA